MTEMIGGDRAYKTCGSCRKTDDHPMCRVQDPDTGLWTDLHTDCHYNLVGPGWGCHAHCENDAHTGKTGIDMLDHILEYGMKSEAP